MEASGMTYPAAHEIPLVDDAGFERAVAAEDAVVAVEFGAAWCPPCRLMEPVVEAAAQEYAGRVQFFRMDADASPDTLATHGVRGLPTLLLFRRGKEIERIVGAQSLSALRTRLDRGLG